MFDIPWHQYTQVHAVPTVYHLEYDSDRVKDINGWICIMFVIIIITDCEVMMVDVLCSDDRIIFDWQIDS